MNSSLLCSRAAFDRFSRISKLVPIKQRFLPAAVLCVCVLALGLTSPKASAQNNEWTWMGGTDSNNQAGVYGTLGTPATGNLPGSRDSAATWTDSNGNLWLFGGTGIDASGNLGYLNDLWEYSPSTNQWTWMG